MVYIKRHNNTFSEFKRLVRILDFIPGDAILLVKTPEEMIYLLKTKSLNHYRIELETTLESCFTKTFKVRPSALPSEIQKYFAPSLVALSINNLYIHKSSVNSLPAQMKNRLTKQFIHNANTRRLIDFGNVYPLSDTESDSEED